MQPRVQAQVAKDKIDATISVDITRHDSIPPPRAVLQPLGRDTHELRTGVVEYGDRHPLAHDHEIETPVAIYVDPECVCDHPELHQVGRNGRRNVGEVAAAVVVQQRTGRIDAVAARCYTTTDEHEVFGNRDARAAPEE